MADRGATIDVLHVDDDEDFTALARRFLTRQSEAVRVEVEADPAAALDRLVGEEPGAVDCVVSDLDMPGLDGLSLLEAVRAKRPDLPFILFTGKGSEEVASDAIAAGVTDYLQKSGGSDQFAILANRIENAVAGHRASREIERAERRFRKLIEESVDVVAVFDVDGTLQYLSPAAEAVVGYEPETLASENVFDHLHPDDRERVLDRFSSLFDEGVERVSARCQFRAEDGDWVDLDVRGRDMRDDPDVGGVLVYGQDASGRVRRDRELGRYETMVNESGDMIYATDETGLLTAVNDAAASYVGYRREELVGEHVSEIVTEESFERGYRTVMALQETDDPSGVTLEQEYVTAEGRVVPGEAHLTILRGPDRSFHGVVGVVRDTSSRRDREETLRALHGATHDLVAAGSREEIIDALVTTAQEVLGLPLVGLWRYDEVVRGLVPVVYPDDPRLPEEPPVYREGDGLSWDAFVSGETRIYDDLGRKGDRYNPETSISSEIIAPIGDHGVLNSGSTEPDAFDESDRYLVEILARNAAAALDRVDRETVLQRLHGATRSMIEAETAEEIATLTAETARDVLGHAYPMVRLLSTDGRALVPVATSDSVDHRMEERPTYPVGEGTAGIAFERGETTIFDRADLEAIDDGVDRADAETILCVPIAGHGVLTIGDLEGDGIDQSSIQLVSILAANAETALDRIDRQRELERQNERLEEFASVASHDLRNPLNVAISHLELLGDEVEGDRIHRVQAALDRMDALIDDVLSLARGGRDVIDPAPVSIAIVAREAWETVGPDQVTLAIEDDLGTVACDRGRLRQLLENLFRNVDEHAQGASTVWIGRTDTGVYVEDDGPGIPAADRGRVLESGYTTRDGGTGFGLAIVERIAEAHGWCVDVVEGREGGARFEVSGVEAGDG